MLIHVLKITTILFESKCFLQIYNIVLSEKDYFFRFFDSINFSVYVHVINSKTKFILIRNYTKNVITMSRSFWIELLNEMNYFNAYVVNAENSNFAIKSFKSKHKNILFNKIFTTCTTVVSLVISNIDEIQSVYRCHHSWIFKQRF